jgi:dTDP-4-dehydrorhamnose reductase
MLGHELVRGLSPRHDVSVTLRQPAPAYAHVPQLADVPCHPDVDLRRPDALPTVLADVRPDAVINAVGLVKQRREGQTSAPAIELNALLPHRLATQCRAAGARFVHLSTDCVFSGSRGAYTETDHPDARDVYGMTKLLGEVQDGSALVLRTSIIGLELKGRGSLVEWFLAAAGEVRGFRRAIYTGLTTMETARLVDQLLREHPGLHGVWHAASEPITKYDLLHELAARLARADVTVVPDDTFACDRSLRADRLRDATGYTAPSWDQMLTELVQRIQERETAT